MVNQALKPKVSKEEEKYRKNNYADVSKVLNKNPLCTSCNGPVKSMIINGKPLIHPFLETLLCEKCFSFYGDGDFSVDEDGSDKYCRWCGQGGTLYLCSSCTAGFCKKCIKRNLSRSILKDVEGSDWDCFCCHVKPLYDLRAQAWAALQHSQNTGQAQKRKSRPRSSRKSESDDNDSDFKSAPAKRSSRASTKKPALSMEEKAYKLALSKQNELLTEVINVCDTVKRKAEEIKNKKLSKRATDSINVETIEVFHNKIASVFDLFKQITQVIAEKTENFLPEWKKVLEKAIEEDKTNKESELVENGDTKRSKKSDDDSEEASSSKRKSRSRKTKDSDEESDEGKKSKTKSTKANKDSDDESEEETKSKTRSKKSTKDSDDEWEEERKPKSRSKKSTKDSDDESEEEKKPKSRSKKSTKDSDDESEEEKKPKSRSKKSAKDSDDDWEELKKLNTRPKKATKDSDDESEKETKSKTRTKKATKDSDDESEEETKTKTRSKKSTKDSDVESEEDRKSEEHESKNQKSKTDESEEDKMSNDEDESNKSMKRKRSISDSEDKQSKQSLLPTD